MEKGVTFCQLCIGRSFSHGDSAGRNVLFQLLQTSRTAACEIILRDSFQENLGLCEVSALESVFSIGQCGFCLLPLCGLLGLFTRVGNVLGEGF